MGKYVDINSLANSIEYFRSKDYSKPEQIGLFLYFKASGLNGFGYAPYKKWGDFENSFSHFMSRQAWGIYLFHYLPLSASAWYLHLYISLPPLVMYLLVCASAFAGAIILYEIIRRIPVLRWCVCGIGGEK